MCRWKISYKYSIKRLVRNNAVGSYYGLLQGRLLRRNNPQENELAHLRKGPPAAQIEYGWIKKVRSSPTDELRRPRALSKPRHERWRLPRLFSRLIRHTIQIISESTPFKEKPFCWRNYWQESQRWDKATPVEEDADCGWRANVCIDQGIFWQTESYLAKAWLSGN